jgi:Tfp pilus assembly protein PilX
MNIQQIRRPAAAPNQYRQRGATLVVALIMLVLLTMLALTSFSVGNGNLQVVGNMQQRNEALAASQEAIEQVLSNTNFITAPAAVFPNPCNGVANQYCVDKNGDGKAEVVVKLTPNPTCVKARNIKQSELALSSAEDLGCSVGAQQTFGVSGANNGDSLCAASTWEIHAVATDSATQASVEVTQGADVRVATDDVAKACP